MRKLNRSQVLGSHFRRTRHRPHRNLPRRFWSLIRKNKRLFQRSHWRKIRSKSYLNGLRTRNYGLRQSRTIRSTFQTWQLRLRINRSWKQLGQRSLHRRSRTHRFSPRRRQKRSRRMWLPPRILNHPLIGRRNRFWYGNIIDLQSQRRISRQNHGNFLSCPITKSLRHRRWTIQRHLISPLISRKRRWMYGHW